MESLIGKNYKSLFLNVNDDNDKSLPSLLTIMTEKITFFTARYKSLVDIILVKMTSHLYFLIYSNTKRDQSLKTFQHLVSKKLAKNAANS